MHAAYPSDGNAKSVGPGIPKFENRNLDCQLPEIASWLCEMNEAQVFAELGEDGISRMVAEFYRLVKTDDLLRPMYPEGDWEGSEERLREFLLFRIGGDPRYMEKRGHPRLRMRHIHFRIGIEERNRWLSLMDQAMETTAVPESARPWLDAFFLQVADFMRNQPE